MYVSRSLDAGHSQLAAMVIISFQDEKGGGDVANSQI